MNTSQPIARAIREGIMSRRMRGTNINPASFWGSVEELAAAVMRERGESFLTLPECSEAGILRFADDVIDGRY